MGNTLRMTALDKAVFVLLFYIWQLGFTLAFVFFGPWGWLVFFGPMPILKWALPPIARWSLGRMDRQIVAEFNHRTR